MNVRMSHLFAVAHFLLNYIPTVRWLQTRTHTHTHTTVEIITRVCDSLLPCYSQAGPIVATVLPLPIVVLDPDLSVAAKIAAFAGAFCRCKRIIRLRVSEHCFQAVN